MVNVSPRDILDAQTAVASAQNAVTAAFISFHTQRLKLLNNTGILNTGLNQFLGAATTCCRAWRRSFPCRRVQHAGCARPAAGPNFRQLKVTPQLIMKRSNLFPFSAAALVAVTLAGCNYFSGDDEISSTYGTEKVENEQFIVSFSEGGELVSVNAVKVENEMDGSASIVSIVDEGSYVKGPRQIQAEAGDTPAKLAARHKIPESDLLKANPNLEQAIANQESITVPGDLLVELDPGSLKDRILSQEISVRTSKNSLIKSQNDLEIQKLRNEQNIDDAKISLNFADLDLKKFKNSDARLTREDYAGQLSNLSNKVSISEAKLVYLRELEKKQFLSKMSLREEEQKVAEFRHNIRMMRGESDAYEKYVYPKSEQDYNSKIKQAELSLTTVEQNCHQ